MRLGSFWARARITARGAPLVVFRLLDQVYEAFDYPFVLSPRIMSAAHFDELLGLERAFARNVLAEGAVSHACSCTFHCARALLLMDGLEARTHRPRLREDWPA